MILMFISIPKFQLASQTVILRIKILVSGTPWAQRLKCTLNIFIFKPCTYKNKGSLLTPMVPISTLNIHAPYHFTKGSLEFYSVLYIKKKNHWKVLWETRNSSSMALLWNPLLKVQYKCIVLVHSCQDSFFT